MKVLAEFESAGRATHALTALTALGYLDLETYAPFPLTDEQAHAPRGSFPLAFLAFGGGLTGLAYLYVIQWWANVESYPLNIGGRPAHAAAAFVPASFETVCLLATLGVFAGFLLLERLPRLREPGVEIRGFRRRRPRGTVPLEGRAAVDAVQGQHQFEVFCAVCHGSDGTGQPVMSADMPGPPPPSLLSGSAAERSDTESAAIIANGINRMPGYAWALSAPERAAIVAYMRRLQQSARPAAGAAR